jgi:two-component system NtrC family sensor kinase
MQQVIINLIMNAAEAMQTKGGGEVTLRTWTNAERTKVHLAVLDKGDGIPVDLREKIFNPFFTTKEEGKGVGLGLAVVYGIIEAHHGDILVDSEVGKGTTFTVILPLETASGPGVDPRREKEMHA